LFEDQSYEQALVFYEDYLARYPEKPSAAAVLMKIARIHSILKDYEKARSAYQRVISDYPDSSWVPDARVEFLYAFYREGRYRDIIILAADALAGVTSTLHTIKLYALVGDAYLAMGKPMDAVRFYLQARSLATDFESEAVREKLHEAIAQLDSSELAVLAESIEDDVPRGDLRFQLGLNYVLEEKYDDALNVLSEFIERHPQHENVPVAASLIEAIKKDASYNHYAIGCLLPLSGPYETFGLKALRSIELALAQFSAQGSSPALNIIVKDTGADPTKTSRAMQELVEAQVAAIIGPMVTAETAARQAQDSGIPIITITQKDNIAEIGDNVFRNFITPKMQVEALAAFAFKSLGISRFAILYPDENYGITFMNLFWDEILEYGGQVVALETYNPAHTDFAEPIKKLVGLYYEVPEDLKEQADLNATDADDTQTESSTPGDDADEIQPIVDFDAIFIPDAPQKTGLIIPQLAYYDIGGVYLLGTNLWHSDTLIAMAEKYVQGAIMPDGFFAESPSELVQEFVRVFEETYQETPGFIDAVVYDSAMILFHVVSQPYVRSRDDLRDELLSLKDFPGVTGLTSFDENGEARKTLYLLRVKGANFVELGRY
ncbi:MAG: penicillin-binding protein activator, partial [Desulfobacterales bacterium]